MANFLLWLIACLIFPPLFIVTAVVIGVGALIGFWPSIKKNVEQYYE